MRQAAVDEHPQGHAAYDGAQPDDAAFLPLAVRFGSQDDDPADKRAYGPGPKGIYPCLLYTSPSPRD